MINVDCRRWWLIIKTKLLSYCRRPCHGRALPSIRMSVCTYIYENTPKIIANRLSVRVQSIDMGKKRQMWNWMVSTPHYGSVQPNIPACNDSLSHKLGSETVSKWVNKWLQWSVQAKRAVQSKQMIEQCERTDEWMAQCFHRDFWFFWTIVLQQKRDIWLWVWAKNCVKVQWHIGRGGGGAEGVRTSEEINEAPRSSN